MAVTINARGTSVSTFRFGKSGNFIGTHAVEGLFTSTDGNIANLTTIKVGPPVDADDAATRQFVLDNAGVGGTTISAGDSSIVVADAGSGSVAITIDASTIASFTSTKFDLVEGVQLSAGNGTVGSPAYTFEADLDSGLLYQPLGGPNSEDQVAISSDGLVIQKWRVQNATSGVDYLVTEASLGEAKLLIEGASTNADLELSGKGTGLIIAPSGYDMSAGPAESFATKSFVEEVKLSTTSKTSAYTTVESDDIVFVNTTGGTVTITLGTVAVAAGKQQIIKDLGGNAGTNNITIVTEAAETIDGAASQIIINNFESLTVVSDGTNWFVI